MSIREAGDAGCGLQAVGSLPGLGGDKTCFRNKDDGWSAEGRRIHAPEAIEAIRRYLEEDPIVVEYWFYRGARSPDRMVFEGYEEFAEHLESRTAVGDAIHVWSFAAVCHDDNNELASGTCPDEERMVPRRGAC